MDMISGLLSQTQPKPQTAYETITKLCDRLLHSNLIEDRRTAVLGLKGFSRDYRETVAAGALKGLIAALQKDHEDPETCRATLETLIVLFIKGQDNETQVEEEKARRTRRYQGPNGQYPSPLTIEGPVDYIALWLTDEFTQVSIFLCTTRSKIEPLTTKNEKF